MASHEENTNKNPANPSLPVDMISEIFSRLPADCLSYLKRHFEYNDFKSWKSLISSPEFAKTHLSKLTNDPGLTHHRLLLITWPYVVKPANASYMKLSSCSVNALLNDNDETDPETNDNDETDLETNDNDETDPETNDNDEIGPEIVTEYHPGDDNICVVGYCNGLFCVSSWVRGSEELFLWNPFTTKSTRLPKWPKHEHGHRAYGFSYDESNDDYKVFSLFRQGSKSGGWKIIGDYYFGEIYSRGSFANGAMHWLAERKNMQFNNVKSSVIVSIDIKTETSGEVSLPPKGQGERLTTLGTFGENLSVLYEYEACADFWVMKEYGVEESWTKLFIIPFITGLPCHSWIKPLCISIGGDIMLLSGSAIVLYNPKSDTFKKLLDMSDKEFEVDELNAYTYIESLVSPPELSGSTKGE